MTLRSSQQQLMAEASESELLPERAMYLARHAPIEVAEALGRNPALPPEAVAQLAARLEVTLRRSAALHPQIPRSTLQVLALDPSEAVQHAVTRLPSTDGSMLEQIANNTRGPSVDLALAQHPETPPSVQLALVSRGQRVRLTLAQRASVEEALLLKLLGYPEFNVHALVAARPALPDRVQALLTQSRNSEVLAAMVRNPDASAATLSELIQSNQGSVKEAAWSHPHVPIPLLISSILDPATPPSQHGTILSHPAFPSDIREAMASLSSVKPAFEQELAAEEQRVSLNLAVVNEEERQRLAQEAQQTLLHYRLDLEAKHRSRVAQLHAKYAQRLQRERELNQQQVDQRIALQRKNLERELTRRHAEEYAHALTQAAARHEAERQNILAELRAQERQALTTQRQALQAAAQQRLEAAVRAADEGRGPDITAELEVLRAHLMSERERELSNVRALLEDEFRLALEEVQRDQAKSFEIARKTLIEWHAQETKAQREALHAEHMTIREAATHATRELSQQRGQAVLSTLREELQEILDLDLKEYAEALENETQIELLRSQTEIQRQLGIKEAQVLSQLEEALTERKKAIEFQFVQELQIESTELISHTGQSSSSNVIQDLLGRPPRQAVPLPPPLIEEALRALWRSRHLSMPDLDGVLTRTGTLRAARRAFTAYAEELIRMEVPLLVQDFSTTPPTWQIDQEVLRTL